MTPSWKTCQMAGMTGTNPTGPDACKPAQIARLVEGVDVA